MSVQFQLHPAEFDSRMHRDGLTGSTPSTTASGSLLSRNSWITKLTRSSSSSSPKKSVIRARTNERILVSINCRAFAGGKLERLYDPFCDHYSLRTAFTASHLILAL